MITDKELLRLHRKAERSRQASVQDARARNRALQQAVAEGRRPAELARLLGVTTGRMAQLATINRADIPGRGRTTPTQDAHR